MKEKMNEEEKNLMMIQLKEDLDKEKAREESIKEGGYSALSQGVGHSYISAFAEALGASNAQMGMIGSLPFIIGPLAQLRGAKLIENQKRMKVVSKYAYLHGAMWIFIIALAIMSYLNIINNLPLLLIIIYSILVFMGGTAFPGWFSWIGDMIPEDRRGRYFSKRNKFAGSITLFSMLVASFFLDYFKTKGLVLIGFSILFFIAFVARMISAYKLSKQYDLNIKQGKKHHTNFFKFVKNLNKTNFGRFTTFIALLSLVKFIAGPFFIVYMLRDLQFTYTWVIGITVSTTIFTLGALPVWGRFADKYGNKLLLKIGSLMISLVPILWIFSPNPIYLLLIPGFIGGVGWSAFNLATNDFLYDALSPEKRASYISYYSVLIGIGILIGGIIGSIITQYVNINFMNKILFVFLISGILRYAVSMLLVPRIKEVRKVRKPRKITRAVLKEIRPIHLHLPTGISHEPLWSKSLVPIKINGN